MKRILIALAVLGLASIGVVATKYALAQDEESGRFVRFIERQISTPDRRINLGPIQGALSSDVRIGYITIADRQGVWLRIDGAHLIWSRLALLRGRLSIDLLEAESITISRTPLPVENDTPLESGAEQFEVPSLPVSVILRKLSVPKVDIAEGIIGPPASLSVDGNITLADGALDTDLAIKRLDRPGDLNLAASFDNSSRNLAIDFKISEPEDGVIANALDIEGRPPLSFTIKGEGPLAEFKADILLAANSETLLSGTTTIDNTDAGFRFIADIKGNVGVLVPDVYGSFVEGGSELKIDATRAPDGAITVSEGRLVSGVARIDFTADVGADGVPTALSLNGDLRRADGDEIALPGGGGASTIRSAVIRASLGGGSDDFSAEITLNELDTSVLSAPEATIQATGTATNLGDAARRAVTFKLTGNATGMDSGKEGVSDALGSALDLEAAGSWSSGEPLTVETLSLQTDTVEASFAGTILNSVNGRMRLATGDISAFAAVAGRDLAGAIDIAADGNVGFDGTFDLILDGTATNVKAGSEALDGLLDGRTRLSGRAARTDTGLVFDTFRLENPQLNVSADGRATAAEADLKVDASLQDLSLVNSEMAGGIQAQLAVTGNPARPAVNADVTGTEITLSGQKLSDLALNFDGVYTRSETVAFDLDGTLAVTGSLDGRPVSVNATLETGPDARALQDLSAAIAGATLAGDIAFQNVGTLAGHLEVDIPDLSRLASLALQDATGSLKADVTLSVADGHQVVAFDGAARNVTASGVSLTEADIDMVVDDVFGIPALDGRANLRKLDVAGYEVVSADLTAQRQGETSNLALDADLGSGELSGTGALSRTDDGFSARVATLRLAQGDFEAELRGPTEIGVNRIQRSISIGDTVLNIGDGTVQVEGELGNELDLNATIEDLPLRIANLIQPELKVGGVVSGTVALTGTRALPNATVDIEANGVTAAILAERGIDPLTVTARGSYIDKVATLETFHTNVGGGEINASGTVGKTLDIKADVSDLPLALANAVRPELEVSGSLSGNVTATGTLEEPNAQFDVRVVDANAKPLRDARLDPLNATAVGTFANGTAVLQTFETTIGGGRITASGSVGQQLDVTAEIINLPLALAEAVDPSLDASGTLSGRVSASGTLDNPSAEFAVDVNGATVAQLRSSGIQPLNATARGSYANKVATLQTFETTVGGGAIRAAGTIGDALDITVNVDRLPLALANAADPSLGLSGTVTGRADVSGSLKDPAADFSINVDRASARLLEGANVGAVNATVAGRYADETATLTTAEARLGQGTLSATGSVSARAMDLTVKLSQIPLAIANGFAPELGVAGALSGEVTAQGSPSNPQVRFTINAPSVSAAPLRDAGMGPGSIDAAGSMRNQTVTIDRAAVNLGGGSLNARGTVGRRLNLSVDLSNLPVAIANGFVPNLGLTGRLSGSATATGSLSNPSANFNLSGTGISALPLQDAGVGALTVNVAGSYGGRGITISSARAEGSGLNVTASGFVPLSGGGLDVAVRANAPLSLANHFLASRGSSLSGDVVADVRARGSLSNPTVSGSVRSSGFTVRDPLSNLVLNNGQLVASMDGNRIVVDRLTASLGDGTVSVTGSIGLGAGFPADLTFVANNARYSDGQLVAVTLSANLGIKGPLTGPRVEGRVDIDRAEITVPTRLSGTAALLEVSNFNTPSPVLETLRRAHAGPFTDSDDDGGSNASGFTLDVTISAPRRIFVRGRGIDAELGGELRVTGPVSDIQPVGEFHLIRGQMNILTQRIVLDEGRVTLFGDLNPQIYLVAETSRNQVTVRVIVDGPANDPQVRFESVPDLPQDEVLSQLIFGQSIDDLSPFQLAQLAAAVAELAGVGNGPSIIDQVRAFSGLDNLEIITTETGSTAVQAGRYIADNVYVGVRAGEKSSGVTVSIDITRGLKARGEAMTDESTIGLYYEREY
ncbi:translocation/assembly module TamB domain-containing protein [Acuticoccus sediminis]|uniref:translocation/assembly module TamB domain-containing protein n=1 Tax=Acuticoccus sediminis TaxID=2184697 RepID=UPI001CFCE0D4|nr:translocation/assembly module TamB domain-containing protein [Acuticoccus sediminis]